MRMAEDPERKSEPKRHQRKGHAEEEKVDAEVEKVTDPDRPRCPHCGWHNTRLSYTRTALDKILRAFSLRAFRCRTCGNRFRVVRRPPDKV